MVVCSYAVWQYREEGIAVGSRRIFIKTCVDGDGILVVGVVGVVHGWELCFWCARRDW